MSVLLSLSKKLISQVQLHTKPDRLSAHQLPGDIIIALTAGAGLLNLLAGISYPNFLKLQFLSGYGNYLSISLPMVLIVLCLLFYIHQSLYMRTREKIIKDKLAKDLHDDIGGTLNSLKIFAGLALRCKEEKYLSKINEVSTEAIANLRIMLWKLDDKDNSVEALALRIKDFADFLCISNGIQFSIQVSKEVINYQLQEDEKQNIFLIIKEAINNSIKYAACNEILLNIDMRNHKPVITVKDNGKGFMNTAFRKSYGIMNMKDRAYCIGYEMTIESSGGTTVKMHSK